jgi:ABC-2 type transport system ATP-binding protein
MLQTLRNTVQQGNRTVLMSGHVMDDIQEVCDSIVMIYKGRIVVHSRIEELASQVDEEIEISVWGGASRMQESLESRGLSVRRLGRIIRVKVESEDTISTILECAVESGVQVRRMGEYEPDLEDIFLLIMDKLGAEVKTTSDLMTPEHTRGAYNE